MSRIFSIACLFLASLIVAGCGSAGDAATGATSQNDTQAPSIPTNLAVTRTNGTTVSLTWSASTDSGGSGLAGYQIFRDNTQLSTSTITGTTFSDTNAPGANSYQVRAIDVAGNTSGLSTPVSSSPPGDATPPTAPTNLTATASGSSSINLSWTASTDNSGTVAGYQVLRNGTQVPTANPITTTTFQDTGLQAGTQYTYTVRAFDPSANLSALSNQAQATTAPAADQTAPTVPTNLAANRVSGSRVDLSWSASTDAGGSGLAGYQVFKNGSQLVQVPTTTFSDTAATAAANYQVRSIDGAGNVSALSPAVNVPAPGDTTPPTIPGSLTATAAGSTSINLAWSASTDTGGAGLLGYQVFRDGVLIASLVTATNFADSSLQPNTSYSYTVRAIDGASNVSGQSNTANATTAADQIAPGVPTGLAAQVNSSTQITVSWTASTDTGGSGLAGYLVFRGATQITPTPIAQPSYVDSALAANTSYSYTVRAVDNAGNNSAASAPVSATTNADTTAPSAPSGLAGTAISETRIDLSWNAATDTGGSGFAGYRVFRNGAQLPGTVSGTSFSDTGLTLSTSYTYTVRAVDNANNESPNSNQITVSTLADSTAPSVPTNLAATATGNTSISLTWSASTDNVGGSGLQGYEVFRGGVLITPTPIAPTSFADTGLTPNTAYNYTVRAVDQAGNRSAQSASAGATTPSDTQAPTTPTGLAATAASSSRIDLSWNASTDEVGGSGLAGYRVYRGGVLISPTLVAVTSYSDTGLAPNTSYSYTVRAVDNAGNATVDSNTANAQTQVGTGAPTPPGSLAAAVVSANRIDLSWTASTDNSGTGIAGYLVFRDGSQITPTPVAAGTLNFSDTGLTPNTTYTYFVRGVDNAANASANSNVVTPQTQPDTTAPSVPTGVTATANSSTQITVAWTASTDTGGTGVAGYRVFRGGVLITPTLVSASPFVDTALAANTTYSYTVRAVDVVGNVSADSAPPATAQTQPDTTAPSTPSGLTVSSTSSTQLSVSWSASTDTGGSGLRGYLVFRNGTQLTPTPISSTSYADSGLTAATSYNYIVRAIDFAGNVSADATGAGTTLADTTPPPAPGGVAAVASSSTSIAVSWNAVTDTGGSGLQGYLVFRGATQLTPTSITQTTYNDTGLAASTAYSYTVRAVDNAGNTSTPSAAANATTLADTIAPAAPATLVAVTQSSTSIQLNWSVATDTGGSGLAGYRIFRNGSLVNTGALITLTTFTDTGLSASTNYTYTVRAVDGANNESSNSPSASDTTQADAIAPTAPASLTATALTSTSIGLSWAAGSDSGGSGLAGYRVYRGGALVNTGALIAGTTFTDTGLAANTAYSYTVRSVDGAGNESGNSPTANATTPAASTGGLDVRPSNTSCLAPVEPTSSASYAPQRMYPNRYIGDAVHALQAPGDSSRWYMVEQEGQVRSFDASDSAGSAMTTTINITDRVVVAVGGGELGLLGMAFHPNYASNGWAYLSYTANGTNGSSPYESRVSRFSRLANGNLDPNSEVVLLRIPQPFSNHNGGHIAFGPDGYLYFGTGDGGSGGDPNGNAQRKTTLLGKMLRVDVSPGTSYTIPPTNPYSGNPSCNNAPGAHGVTGNNCPEIYALGLRNPWRWSFDRGSSTPKLWLGDVGQSASEEIDIISLGGNYGWNCREGASAYSGAPGGCVPAPGDPAFVDPVLDLGRSLGPAVTGGVVYRGTALPALVGSYLFADFYSSNVHRAVLNADGSYSRVNLYTASTDLTASFTEDNAGEVYVVGYENGLYKIVANSSTSNNSVPSDLAATGCVDTNNPQLPASGLIPFTPNAPFWSDNAAKERWMALPNGTTITVNGDGDWTFPAGTVLMKHFRLNNRLFETRLFMRHTDTLNWRGYTYRWNLAGTQATRVDGGLTETVEGQPWTYPSSTECLQCHTSAAGFALGPETAQLNGSITYPQTGRTANQLTTLNAIGMFASTLPDASTLPAYADPAGGGTLVNRARAYLHTNCASCHRPGGGTGSNMDLRHDTAIGSTNTCNVDPSRGTLGIANAKLIAPNDPSRSIVYQRMNRRGLNQMPPLGSHIVDSTGASLLSAWITAMGAGCN